MSNSHQDDADGTAERTAASASRQVSDTEQPTPSRPNEEILQYFVFALVDAKELVAVQRTQAVKDNFCGHFETVWKAKVHRWELRPTKLVRMMVVDTSISLSCLCPKNRLIHVLF